MGTRGSARKTDALDRGAVVTRGARTPVGAGGGLCSKARLTGMEGSKLEILPLKP